MSLIIPGSIANYVTGVSERSQRTCGEDHDAKITLLHPTRLAESPPEFFSLDALGSSSKSSSSQIH
ncbi:Uncharacterised protein [Salmonella sp. NCTC 11881]|nr:Uncharacterised protein [Salmonella sp. NCTC 11881]